MVYSQEDMVGLTQLEDYLLLLGVKHNWSLNTRNQNINVLFNNLVPRIPLIFWEEEEEAQIRPFITDPRKQQLTKHTSVHMNHIRSVGPHFTWLVSSHEFIETN